MTAFTDAEAGIRQRDNLWSDVEEWRGATRYAMKAPGNDGQSRMVQDRRLCLQEIDRLRAREATWEMRHARETALNDLHVKRIAQLEAALQQSQHAMRAPLDDWKGEVERKALDAARAALRAHADLKEVGRCHCGASYYRQEYIGKPCEIQYCRGVVQAVRAPAAKGEGEL